MSGAPVSAPPLGEFVPRWAWALMIPGIACALLGGAGLAHPEAAARWSPLLANPAICLLLVAVYFASCTPAGAYVIAYFIRARRAQQPSP